MTVSLSNLSQNCCNRALLLICTCQALLIFGHVCLFLMLHAHTSVRPLS